MKNAPNLIKGNNDAKGVQLEYTLLPLATIEKMVLEEENPVNRAVQSIDNALIADCLHKMEELELAKQNFNDLYERVKENANILNGQVLVSFNTLKSKTTSDENTFLKNLGEVIVQVSFFLFHLRK